MKPLIKVMLIVGAAFATTFVLGRLLGILTVENVRHWLELAQTVNPLWVAATVIFLLFMARTLQCMLTSFGNGRVRLRITIM